MTPKQITALVCEKLEIPPEFVYKKLKFGKIPLARNIIFYILREQGYSNWQIAREFSFPDSTCTAIYKRACKKYRTNQDFRIILKIIQNEFSDSNKEA